MNNLSRLQLILKKAQTCGSVSISELAEELQVSSMTIRRDLNKLAANGLLTLEQGGAILNSGSLFEYSIPLKEQDNAPEKIRIAEKCLDFIKEGDSIFLDGGTSVNELAKLLGNKRNILVLTNSLLAANTLSKFKQIRTIMCPGEFRETSMAYMGPLTSEFISRFQIDTLFLGIEGIDPVRGLTVPDIQDGLSKQSLINSARKVICTADSSKFHQSFLYEVAPLSRIDFIVTDNRLEEAALSQYLEKGTTIIRA